MKVIIKHPDGRVEERIGTPDELQKYNDHGAPFWPVTPPPVVPVLPIVPDPWSPPNTGSPLLQPPYVVITWGRNAISS